MQQLQGVASGKLLCNMAGWDQYHGDRGSGSSARARTRRSRTQQRARRGKSDKLRHMEGAAAVTQQSHAKQQMLR